MQSSQVFFFQAYFMKGKSLPECNQRSLKENTLKTSSQSLARIVFTVTNKKFTYTNDFRKSLENGVILCELLNILKPDCIRRINRHSTPIAGIDNLNQFLKACQEHFGLSQANLFDITDLEDLVKRRGTISNNFSAKNENPNLNHHSIDQEQQRRLKKET
ncbi:LIM and calponin homology domains-containing 1-like isoform X3 [Brachionus plicatilis]|uniref:LIM and calponin homology domains-containing 1-like isoform X3 n=1 Tax=Brachionus plicatilis TaxID=10195 RepID=A0A3M7QBP2_BRAPC|nr:LIM and calponin homology domains-containing 1-like isoform X3 [Brachionus plicatilis]